MQLSHTRFNTKFKIRQLDIDNMQLYNFTSKDSLKVLFDFHLQLQDVQCIHSKMHVYDSLLLFISHWVKATIGLTWMNENIRGVIMNTRTLLPRSQQNIITWRGTWKTQFKTKPDVNSLILAAANRGSWLYHIVQFSCVYKGNMQCWSISCWSKLN